MVLLKCRRCLDRCALVFDLTGGCGHSKVEELSMLCSDSAAKCSSFSDRQSRASQLYLLVLLESCQFFQVDIVWFSRLVQPLRFISTTSFLRNVFDVVNLCLRLQVSFRCSEFGELVLCELWMEICASGFTLVKLPVYFFFWYPLSVIKLSQKWTCLLKFLCNCLVSHFIAIDYFLMSWYHKSVFDSLWRKNASLPLIHLTSIDCIPTRTEQFLND